MRSDKDRPDRRERKARPPLDASALQALALRYVERYATTRAKLRRYLQAKLRERGWAGEGEPPVAALAERMADLRYVDDRLFGESRARGLAARGYGERRVRQSLAASGVGRDDAANIAATVDDVAAAVRLARRRRFGPFGIGGNDPDLRRRQLAAMARAGHAFDLARRILDAPSPEAAEAIAGEE